MSITTVMTTTATQVHLDSGGVDVAEVSVALSAVTLVVSVA